MTVSGSKVDRIETGERPACDLDAFTALELRTEVGQRGLGVGEHRGVGVPQVDGDHRLPGNHVDEVGVEIEATDGGDLRPADLVREAPQERDDLGRRVPGVATHRHRRRAGVVGLTDDRQLLPRDALHALDDADRHSPRLEHRALLDVQLDERGGCGAWARQRPGVADPHELVTDCRTVDADDVERLLEGQAPDIGERAHHVGLEARAFLVGEERHCEGSACRDARCLEHLDHLEARRAHRDCRRSGPPCARCRCASRS